MMTSSNGNIFHVTGPLWRETTSHRWIPPTKASDAGLLYFLWSAPEQTAEHNPDADFWEAIAPITASLMFYTKGRETINLINDDTVPRGV